MLTLSEHKSYLDSRKVKGERAESAVGLLTRGELKIYYQTSLNIWETPALKVRKLGCKHQASTWNETGSKNKNDSNLLYTSKEVGL